MSQELQPCPFCGSKASLTRNNFGRDGIVCSGCQADMRYNGLQADGFPELVEMWNKRKIPKIKNLIWSPWPEERVAWIYQSCTSVSRCGDFHIVLRSARYELNIDDEYADFYDSLEDAKFAAQSYYETTINDTLTLMSHSQPIESAPTPPAGE